MEPGYDQHCYCLLYTSDAADERSSVDLGGRRIIKKKKKKFFFFFFFKQKTAYEMLRSLVGSEMCIRDRSNNGITGTWNPATISTAAAGTTTYTFTPTAGQCATATTTLDVTVTAPVTPTFDPIGALCVGATAPALAAASNNGINGTWNPATISTAAAGTTTYTFTPAAGECASPVSIDITIAAQLTPVFTAIGPLCVGATAPGLAVDRS